MVTIHIGDNVRNLNEIDEGWITQHINRRRANGDPVCIQVKINTDHLDLVLATFDCPRGGGRDPYPREKEIIDLWIKRGLNKPDFSVGNFIAFIKQLKQLL